MTDRTVAPAHVQVHTATHRYEAGVVPPQRYEGGVGLVTPPRCEPAGFKPPTFYPSQRGPSTSQVLAVVLGLPVGGFLLLLAGLTLAGTFIGLVVTASLFILFSPILVPATVIIGLAVAGFLTSGAFGLTALSSFSWMLNYIRECQGSAPETLAAATKHRLADAADYVGQKTKEVGQKTKEVGQDIQNKAQDAKDASARDAAKDTRDVKRTTLTASTTPTA